MPALDGEFLMKYDYPREVKNIEINMSNDVKMRF
jgi:hypothetical protein